MKILQVNTPIFTAPLTYICNKSLLSGTPSPLKFSEVKPLYKKGDRMDITNFTYILFKDHGKSYIYKIVPTHKPK